PSGWIACDYLPEKLLGKVFYEPTGHGQEKRISEFLQQKRKPRGKA
ncbi:replication-associated recombination protein A, partial [bacterium]|nr:replication-associated recombination protein A [bacterium]